MKKYHYEEIRDIFLHGKYLMDIPISINKYVEMEISRKLKSNNLVWAILTVFITIVWIFVSLNMRPSEKQVMERVNPIVKSMQDTMHYEYQKKLNFLVDSLDNYYLTNPPKK